MGVNLASKIKKALRGLKRAMLFANVPGQNQYLGNTNQKSKSMSWKHHSDSEVWLQQTCGSLFTHSGTSSHTKVITEISHETKISQSKLFHLPRCAPSHCYRDWRLLYYGEYNGASLHHKLPDNSLTSLRPCCTRRQKWGCWNFTDFWLSGTMHFLLITIWDIRNWQTV